MNAENIGTWAGLVWNALNDAQKAQMHCALGWLAKEGKLNFEECKDDIKVSLR